MKTIHIAIVVIVGIPFVINSIDPVFAQVTPGPPPPFPITISTDKSLYVGNETITISGIVNEETGKTVHIQIFNSSHIAIRNYTVAESDDGTYRLQIKGNFGGSGQYDIRSYVVEGLADGLPIQYISGPYKLTIEDKVWPINYTLNAGIMKSIIINAEKKSLTMHIIDAVDGVQLGIDLPRKLVDAKSGNSDGKFVVMMRGGEADFRQENYSETGSNPDIRHLVINVTTGSAWSNPTGEWDIRIIGTEAVPEFPLAMLILLTSFVSAIVFYGMRFGK